MILIFSSPSNRAASTMTLWRTCAERSVGGSVNCAWIADCRKKRWPNALAYTGRTSEELSVASAILLSTTLIGWLGLSACRWQTFFRICPHQWRPHTIADPDAFVIPNEAGTERVRSWADADRRGTRCRLSACLAGCRSFRSNTNVAWGLTGDNWTTSVQKI